MAFRVGIDIGSGTVKVVTLSEDRQITELPPREVRGQPLRRVLETIEELLSDGRPEHCLLGVTGAGARTFCELIGIKPIDEPAALTAAINELYPDVRTVIEMGRETQKFMMFEEDEVSGRKLMADVYLGHKCAAGTGSFIDHMVKRLNFSSVQEMAEVAYRTDNPASLSGRCGVFTESDIVHLYQKGTPRERIAAGIHQAICRNYRSNIARGRPLRDKVAFIGGVSENKAVRRFMAEQFGVEEERLFVPKHNRTLSAIGAALRAEATVRLSEVVGALRRQLARPLEYKGTTPLRLEKSEIMKPDPAWERDIPRNLPLAALGVDIGSVSTKAALITRVGGEYRVLASYYRRTDGDPLAAVRDTLSRIYRQVREKGLRIGKIVAGTTGSGRYLTGDYIGADLIKNEITAQARGALVFTQGIDTIFEIGGQDSKYIRLNGDVIVDFEMNKACAAGTGAFLEKIAGNLGVDINDFGDLALRGKNPPDLDWQCTVFSESAMLYYQQNGVPAEELAAATCLASVKNYLNKNVGNRDIGEAIGFQGAVAFNRGMVAAFETLLGKKIVVPPYPHLTGAIGVASLAYEQAPENTRFVGFEKIEKSTYRVTSFECKGCPNRCDVNVFQMGDGLKFYYNDRCERYSAVHKRSLGEGLPNLFAEREELLLNVYDKQAPEGAPRVGIPRGLLFADYFPLWKAFFTELGFAVVASPPTNKEIIKLGLDAVEAEFCYPFKVAHGHVAWLAKHGVEYIFLPGVLQAEQPNPRYPASQTCPYIQAAPEVISAALGLEKRGIKLLRPRFYFNRGEGHVRRVLRELGMELGRSPAEAEQAADVALAALAEFRRRIDQRGREICESLPADRLAFVVIGRPYTLYDEAINMSIGKKIQDLGILALPMDYLPLEREDTSDAWVNAYARQLQKKLAAGRLIKRDPRLRAVVLTYFGCGPDSFANQFFKDEIAEPCYIMQIDEHTADAGVITRIEAFADTAALAAKQKREEKIRTRALPMAAARGRRLWIPYACESAKILVAVLRAYGIDAELLPRSPDEGLTLAREQISEDVCLPALMTTEDILWRTRQPDFDPKREAFFQGSSQGPCRFGMYHMLQRRILDRLGYEDVEIVTFGNRDTDGGLGPAFTFLAWDALVAADQLFKMLLHTRPYERHAGQSEEIFAHYLDELCREIPRQKELLESGKGRLAATLGWHLGPYRELLQRAQREFAAVERSSEPRPLVGIVGEFYVRLHDGSNQNIIRKVEQAGGEVWLAPLTEFFAYTNQIAQILAAERYRDTQDKADRAEAVRRKVLGKLGARDEHRLFCAALPYLDGFEDIGPLELIEKGSRYLHHTFGGEAICSMGKMEDFAERGLDGLISVVPFNCMPGLTVAAMAQELRRRHGNIPFLSIDYDGFVDAARELKIAAFMSQVKERFFARRERQLAAK